MKHVNLLILLLITAAVGTEKSSAQDAFVPATAVSAFKKKEHTVSPPLKTRYLFDVGTTTGREYLRQQDLLDAKGKPKSSGMFSEDGTKYGDIKYSYDAAGNLLSQELKKTGKNEKEITSFNAAGKPEKIQTLTKGDTLLSSISFVYNSSGQLLEESHFKGEKLIRKKIYEDTYNQRGQLLQTCHFESDSTGSRVPGNFPLTVNEYDDQGMILQTTIYNNKEKRKMLSWVYYKYQLDNDYRIIKQSGFNEEQQEICRTELSYTDSSISCSTYKICGCPAKTMEKTGVSKFVYNSYGEKIREVLMNPDNTVLQTSTWRYDDFGNLVEHQVVKAADPARLIKTKTIFEYHSEQASSAKPVKK
jgi:antitoxin component YwqK of YwqJK toxin-antitoxin module